MLGVDHILEEASGLVPSCYYRRYNFCPLVVALGLPLSF